MSVDRKDIVNVTVSTIERSSYNIERKSCWNERKDLMIVFVRVWVAYVFHLVDTITVFALIKAGSLIPAGGLIAAVFIEARPPIQAVCLVEAGVY